MGSSELIGLGLFVLFAVVAAAVMWTTVQRRAQRKEAFIARGWSYQEIPRGYEAGGGEVVPWTLRVATGRGQQKVWASQWTAPAQPAEHAVLVGPKLDLPDAMLLMGGGLVGMLLRMVLGDRASELHGAAEVRTVGTPAFRARFTVIATDADAAEALLTDAVQEALLGSPEDVVVLRWNDEVQLRRQKGLWTPDDAVAFVALGEAVAQGCGY